MSNVGYNDQVFINSPFDDRFRKRSWAFCFTVLDCGFVPRCSLEIDDATQFRLRGILDLIERCRYGIHDLSRVELDERSGLPRFNMPFELGVFYSAKIFGKGKHKNKQCIVFEKQRYRYQKFISDISGIDIKPHEESVKKAIFAVRNWLVTVSRRRTIPPAENIWSRYLKFQRDMNRICRNRGIDRGQMPFVEIITNMTDWLKLNQTIPQPLFG